MRIGMKQSNLDKGYDLLMDVSSHDSSNYGKYYTPEQVNEIFAPADHSVDTIRSWLEEAGIASHRVSQSVNKQWMQFDAAVEEVEQLLKTKFHIWEHLPTGRANIACDEYHVPEHVTEHVDYITPGIKLFTAGGQEREREETLEKRIMDVTQNKDKDKDKKKKPTPPPMKPLPISIDAVKASPDLSICDAVATPDCIAALYNIPKGTKKAKGNELGIFEDLGDVYSQADLDLFFKSVASYIPAGTHPELRAIDGAVAPVAVTAAGAESDLDFEISYPIIWPQGAVLFQTDDPVYEANYTFNGFLNNFLDAIDGSYCDYSAYGETGNSPEDPPYPDPAPGGYKGNLQCGIYKPTNVISISYGGQEPDLPASYQQRQCNEFMKLGLQGVSILVSSGDSGVQARGANGCLGPANRIFNPDFPATCPYITTAGATYLPPGADVKKDSEVAVTRFPSGGGFSNIYPIPSYQQKALDNYFANLNPTVAAYPYYETTNNQAIGANNGIYNRLGRGYPDISAVGDNVLIYNKGRPTLIGGTSASSPAFAAILTRINEERIAKGKKTVGFVNPVLYAHPEVLNDITVGNNSGCGTPGFFAQKGWDPVTGLGTPDYPKLLKLFMGLP